MTKDIALKMAIDAMETADAIVWEYSGVPYEKLQEALKICKLALEQPAQGPQYINVYGYLENQNLCFRQEIGMPLLGKIKLEVIND